MSDILDVDCELCALYVRTKNKGLGIGKALINYVKNKFKNAGRKKMILWCLKDNYSARMFYEKMGGIFHSEKIIIKGEKEYKEVSYLYDLTSIQEDELEIITPNYEHKEQIKNYFQEFFKSSEHCIIEDSTIDFVEKITGSLNINRNSLLVNLDVPSTIYFTLRKSDKKIIGSFQIRHYLNEQLFNYYGHIESDIIPNERNKGYEEEQIKFALMKCKELGITNVMIRCKKDDSSFADTIINNGGILDSEIYFENELIQRYWISLKKRYAYKHIKDKHCVKCKNLFYEANNFSGDIFFYYFKDVKKRYVLPSGTCIVDNDYKWLEFYDYNSKIKLTVMYNEKNDVIEWYFDIARKIGNDNGIPYEDDLYLDVLVTSDGTIKLLDEDELIEAHENYEVNDYDFDNAYKTARELIEKLKNNKEKLKKFTDKYLKEMI